MTPPPDHPVIKEWMFARDILRRLGFQPEENLRDQSALCPSCVKRGAAVVVTD